MPVQRSSLDKTISRAAKDARITPREADKIVKAAGTRVSNAEAKEIGSLYERANNTGVTGHPPPMASPANPRLDDEATYKFNQFFVTRGLPYGDNLQRMQRDIQETLRSVDVGEPLARAPRNKNLQTVELSDRRPVDGALEEALVDTVKRRFYLKITNSGRGTGGAAVPQYYGPLKILDSFNGIDAQRLFKIDGKFERELERGVTWRNALDMDPAQDTRRALLKREPGFDTYSYYLHLPTRRGDGKSIDPNKSNKYWIERQGGLAGLTTFAGPFIYNGRDV